MPILPIVIAILAIFGGVGLTAVWLKVEEVGGAVTGSGDGQPGGVPSLPNPLGGIGPVLLLGGALVALLMLMD